MAVKTGNAFTTDIAHLNATRSTADVSIVSCKTFGLQSGYGTHVFSILESSKNQWLIRDSGHILTGDGTADDGSSQLRRSDEYEKHSLKSYSESYADTQTNFLDQVTQMLSIKIHFYNIRMLIFDYIYI